MTASIARRGAALKSVLAAAALAVGSALPAQGGAPPPPAAPPAASEIAASKAAQRLREAVTALDRGGEALAAFAAANPRPATAPPGPTRLKAMLEMRYRSGGYELLEFTAVSPREAAARVRDKLTGSAWAMMVEVEAEAPHRLLRMGLRPEPERPARRAVSDEERVREVAALAKRLSDADIFSGVVLIAKDGKPIFQQAYGYADREKRIPNALDTRFRLASLNKIFTGVAIGRLVEQGKLSYEDPLAKFVPDYPGADKIRIKHLLSHTSGLGSFGPQLVASRQKAPTVLAALAEVERQPPRFEPGTDWSYSNTGILLLGRVIEVVTGEDFYAHMDRTLFRPLRLRGTGFPDFEAETKKMALPYDTRVADGGTAVELALVEERTRRGGPAGDGASTAPDLLRFARALRTGRLLRPETLKLHSTPKPELKSARYGYAMDAPPRAAPGRDAFGHGGDTGGTCTELGMIRDLPAEYDIVILANSSIGSCHAVTAKVYSTFAPPRPAP